MPCGNGSNREHAGGTNRKLRKPRVAHSREQIAAQIGIDLRELRAEVRGLSWSASM
jgi:hypothetical protein